MFYDHLRHSAPQHDRPHGEWVHSHVAFEAVMATLTAGIVTLVAAVLFLPIWVR